ncbi:hypothetical protein [Pseudomonas phage Alpheus]|uniref:Uncharacterized protein n=1 Tax=Pseudomonas phage Alpheus TaxID=2163983 RepID=A0A2S1GMX6_9CAUD|nr:hypothetical protein HOT11_gp02 [Pseudomonas phage Alpheus]AWD90726.1 hypothetical protein [Pseudomonas phage Alpheus]
MKLVHSQEAPSTLVTLTRRVRVWWNDEWEEYAVWFENISAFGRVYRNPSEDYHTSDKEDALDTAAHWLAQDNEKD